MSLRIKGVPKLKYLSAKRWGTGPTPSYIHVDHLTSDVFASILELNYSRTVVTTSFINAPLNCFDNNRGNECKQNANKFKSLADCTHPSDLFCAMTRAPLIIPLGALWFHKFLLIDICERPRDFDGPRRLICFNVGDKKHRRLNIWKSKAKTGAGKRELFISLAVSFTKGPVLVHGILISTKTFLRANIAALRRLRQTTTTTNDKRLNYDNYDKRLNLYAVRSSDVLCDSESNITGSIITHKELR